MSACSATEPLRILVLSPIAPCPPVGGWATVIYNDIKYLAARGHHLNLLAGCHDSSAEPSAMADIAQAEYFQIPKGTKWRQVLSNVGEPKPYPVARYFNRHLLERASQLVASGQIDVVLLEDLPMAQYANLLQAVAPVPTLYRGHNVGTTVARRFFQSQRNPILRYLGWRQFVKYGRFEAAAMESVDCSAQISPIDADGADLLNDRVSNEVIYGGVDLDYFQFSPPDEREPNTIMHVGTLDPATKLPAMLWFCREVLPLIRRRCPEARLELVGRVPPSPLHDMTAEGVIVHGKVADVRPYLSRGAAFIAPQFVGSGIRIKILTAMGTGNAVVATSVGCEGLGVTHGRNILIADQPRPFADHVGSLLEDSNLRATIAHEGYRFVEQRFAWPRIAEQLEHWLRVAIARHVQRVKAPIPAI